MPIAARNDLLHAYAADLTKIEINQEQSRKQFPLSKQYPQSVVIIQQSVDQHWNHTKPWSRVFLILFCLSLVGFTVSILLLARGIARPVSQLTKATQQVERGNPDYPLATDKNEMGLLLRLF